MSYENDREILLKMSLCYFYNNYAIYSLFTLENSNLQLSDCIFEKNNNTIFGTVDSVLKLENITIADHFCLNNLGCVLISEKNSTIYFGNSFFSNIISTETGNFYIIDSSVKIIECIFENVLSLQYIGSGVSSFSSNLSINSSFFKSFALNCLYLSQSNVSLFETNFQSNLDINITKNEQWEVLYGTIFSEYCDYIYINKSFFEHQNSVSDGGAIYLIQKNIDKSNEILIENSYFFNNTVSDVGGVLFLNNIYFLKLQNNIFYFNIASYGGVIFYDCFRNDSQLILQMNFFLKNKGLLEGGAIKWTFKEPLFIKKNSFIDNQAIYGNDIATLPVRIKINIIPHDENQNASLQFEKEKDNSIPFLYNLLSSSQINFTLSFKMIDIYGQTVLTIGKQK